MPYYNYKKLILKSNHVESSFDEEHQVFCESNFEAIDLLHKANLNKKSGKL